MTRDQIYRGVLAIVIGGILVTFGLALLVKTWRSGERPRRLQWPLPWDTLTGVFLVSVGFAHYVNAMRTLADWSPRTENRLSAVALTCCAVMSAWTFGRWLREDEP